MDDKKIMISGTGNRYQINKLKKEPPIKKIRTAVEKLGLPEDFYAQKNQLDIIQELHNKTELSTTNHYKLIVSQLDAKLSSYKQQDLLKKRYDEALFITTEDTINKLHACSLSCYYCQSKTVILYNIVREMNQWSLDRINNDLGHNADNVVISCLDCNLKRRRTGKDAFLFTKQLIIVKS